MTPEIHCSSSYFIEDYPEPDPLSPEEIAAERRERIKRVLVLVISSIVLVSMIATLANSGILAGSNNYDDDLTSSNNNIPDLSLQTQVKIKGLCTLTQFNDLCVSTMTKYSEAYASDDPKSLILFSVQIAIEGVTSAYNYSSIVNQDGLQSMTKWAFSDCNELLLYALDELQASNDIITAVTLNDQPARMNDLSSALSAAVTYEETCLDGFLDATDKWTVEMKGIMRNASEVTRNSLSIVSKMWPLEMDDEKKGRDEQSGLVEGAEKAKWYKAKRTPDVVVAQDGSGDYKTITAALQAIPMGRKSRDGRFVIYVKEGDYRENVKVTSQMKYVLMYGDGAAKTMVTGGKGFGDGFPVYETATFAVSGKAFMARDIGFRNTAGPGKAQAVALRVESDMSVFYNCYIDGYQNTLYAHAHRQFFRNCIISGTVDIISGDATAVFQSSIIIAKKPLPGQQNTVTAHRRVDQHATTGFVVDNCTISAAGDLFPVRSQFQTYLGRPTKEHSRTVIMQSVLGDLIMPEGWASSPKKDVSLQKSVFFAEYGNRGPGADLKGRVAWPGYHVLSKLEEISKYTAGEFMNGAYWLNMTGVPFNVGLLANSTSS